ncbi:peroxiredoxin [Thermoplasmatales archaeon ex4484_6]|nr:MAG: peroxiredoxin [Thermoplasmatales archaeon ex4484_6]
MDDGKSISMPLIGDEFPSMTVKTTHGSKNLPEDYKGKWFVLFSHPGDFTPVCTTEFVGFQKRMDQFRELDTELIGLSIDQVFAHIKWTEWIHEKLGTKIEFPIIADDQGTVAKRLGMLHPGKGSNTVRAVFVVDDKGILRLILYYPQEIGRNMDEIVRIVKALRTSDEKGVATPANWPENDFLGDRVIIPPASDEDTAESRRGKEDCYDWWFCHKKLD